MNIKDNQGIEYKLYILKDAYGNTKLFSTHEENGIKITRNYANDFSIECEFGEFFFPQGTLTQVLAFYHEWD